MRAFYTVLCDKQGFPVKYVDSETFQMKTFRGLFADPGEASQEFLMTLKGVRGCYLEPLAFQRKARALARIRRIQERRRMQPLFPVGEGVSIPPFHRLLEDHACNNK
jgi:hypothetical protein